MTRRAVHRLSTVLIAAGLGMVGDAAATMAWKEPVTALMAQLRQGDLAADLDRLSEAGPTPAELAALSQLRDGHLRDAFLARSLVERVPRGEAAGRVRIPAVGVDAVVVRGTRPGDLRKGPGFYDGQPLPGAPGTAAIAGHRTTYGAPFRRLDDVHPGDTIEVQMPYGTFTYRAVNRRIVRPGRVDVLRASGRDRLVLTACHPLFSAKRRIVITATLIGRSAEA
jgi:sortase A